MAIGRAAVIGARREDRRGGLALPEYVEAGALGRAPGAFVPNNGPYAGAGVRERDESVTMLASTRGERGLRWSVLGTGVLLQVPFCTGGRG